MRITGCGSGMWRRETGLLSSLESDHVSSSKHCNTTAIPKTVMLFLYSHISFEDIVLLGRFTQISNEKGELVFKEALGGLEGFLK